LERCKIKNYGPEVLAQQFKRRTFADQTELMGSRPGLETIVADEAIAHRPVGLTSESENAKICSASGFAGQAPLAALTEPRKSRERDAGSLPFG